jgi:regulatory protein
VDKTWDKLIKFVTLRPRSEKEVEDWFYRKKVDQKHQKDYFKRLKRLDFLDDGKFTRWWVDQRLSFRPRSKRELWAELVKKGIDKTLIKQVIDESKIDEVKIAKKLLSKRNYQDPQKAMAYLARKGFDWETIKEVKLALEQQDA